MEVELELVPNQCGTAILDAADGKMCKSTGDLSTSPTDEGQMICSSIYRILLDTSKCLGNEPMRRLSVSFSDHNYVVTLGEKHIYIVKTRGSAL